MTHRPKRLLPFSPELKAHAGIAGAEIFQLPQVDRTDDDAKARPFNFADFSEDDHADDEASDDSNSSASDLQQHQQIMACSNFALLGVQPFVFLLNDEGTHFHYITKQSHQEHVRKGCCTLDAMQFCCDVLRTCKTQLPGGAQCSRISFIGHG